VKPDALAATIASIRGTTSGDDDAI